MGRDLTGADLGLLPEGSQSVVVICRSTYEPGGGGGSSGVTRLSAVGARVKNAVPPKKSAVME